MPWSLRQLARLVMVGRFAASGTSQPLCCRLRPLSPPPTDSGFLPMLDKMSEATSPESDRIATPSPGAEERLRRYVQIAVAITQREIRSAVLTEPHDGATVSSGSEVEPQAPHNSIPS